MPLQQKLFLGIQVLIFGWMGVCVAQPTGMDGSSARERVISRFEREAPKLGEPLPNLEIMDAEGKPFRLASLKGSHTVLVFGCLT